MRIGRTRRLHLPSPFLKPAMWLACCAAAMVLVLSSGFAQGPPGAAAAAAGAAAAATASAPAPPPKKTAASAAMDAAVMGNNALSPSNANLAAATPPVPGGAPSIGTQEAATAAAPAVAADVIAKITAGPLPKDVALQCSNLLTLATNLKADVAKTSKDVLSISVIRDAGQIEEIAKKMREAQH